MSEPVSTTPDMPCILKAWQESVSALRRWLSAQGLAADEVDDVVQEVYVKAMLHRATFCALDAPQAWLFTVARHALIDRARLRKNYVDWESLPESILIAEEVDEALPVDDLRVCVPRVLAQMSAHEREAIECCDLNSMSQKAYAQRVGLSISGAKSRLQRARKTLAKLLVTQCQVRFDTQGSVCCFTPQK